MHRILIVDCFDSFTFNIFHSLQSIDGAETEVLRYDRLDPGRINGFSHLVLSPGPGLPGDYPLVFELLQNVRFKGVLGVCLGLQFLVVSAGGRLRRLKDVKHGVSSELQLIPPSSLFIGIDGGVKAGHYHSWVADESEFPAMYHISSTDSEGNIMSVECPEKGLFGVQFHPESVMTPAGGQILRNWLLATK